MVCDYCNLFDVYLLCPSTCRMVKAKIHVYIQKSRNVGQVAWYSVAEYYRAALRNCGKFRRKIPKDTGY